jgi:basic membrane protein A
VVEEGAMMRRGLKWTSLVGVLCAASLLAVWGSNASGSTASTGSAKQKTLKATAFYVAKFSGDQYGKAFLTAFDVLKKKFGVNVQLVENVPYSAQMTQQMKKVLSSGTDVIIDTDSSQQLGWNACKLYPDKYCIIFLPSAKGAPANTIGMNVDEFAPLYAQGVAAGMLTKSGTIGFVNNFKTPNGLSFLNAFALGCQSVKPSCKVRNIYVNSYFNPPAEIEATNTLINAGADVIGQFTDDQAVVTTASSRGAWAFSTYQTMANPPAKYVTGFVWDGALTNGLVKIFTAIKNGTFKQLRNSGVQEGRGTVFGTPRPVDVTLAPWGKTVPANVKARVNALMKRMDNGYSPFRGPIYDAKGKLRIKRGVVLPLRSTFLSYEWNWAVKGVIGG